MFLHLSEYAALRMTRIPKSVLMSQNTRWKNPMKKTVLVDCEKTQAIGANPTIKIENTEIDESRTSNAFPGLISNPARQMKI